ncbi:myb-binding protein 1A-like protein isoform X2 [Brienomyrus brachyistius]|uniref:myb-binding protein 1A-like protein isoform X2 n=1 Tax=Brienomyrus brachyistius TaxID=42636 RepID=UPI0020B1B49A|nr:myb-binding protein 1A-like protein isoform X2 [Brienomyrus brachyistius]
MGVLSHGMATATRPDMGEIENQQSKPKVSDAKGILKQNREFLDFFWDIAKPDQEVRLKAIDSLVQHLKKSKKPDELKYTLKRLVGGLAHTQETARPGFSLALAQVLSMFEEVPLQSVLDQVKETHDLQKTKTKLFRNAVFGSFFGVLALSQSARLPKEPQILLQCIQLLQQLARYREHLKDLPKKTMVDILSETSEEVFDEVLLGALQTDLSSAYSTPEQLQLLLVAMQRFPGLFKPKKLKKLLGTSTIITKDSVPRLVEVLKVAGRSMKKEKQLPPVALDLLQVSLRENTFDLFWKDVVVNGLLTDQSGFNSFLCYRLLGAVLPSLSLPQLRQVLSGEVMQHYGEHVVTAQLPGHFKFAPEMEAYVEDFLKECPHSEKQLAVVVAFSTLTNQGYPVVPSAWRVVQHLQPAALQSYVDWLKEMFCRPKLEACLDFSTRRQQKTQEAADHKQSVFRLRKWIVPRLTSIVENVHVKKEEDLVMDVARFVFFHAFFAAKKPTPDIPETETTISEPLDEKTREIVVNSFFGLLQYLNHMPSLGESLETAAPNEKRTWGVTADGTLWIYCLVQYADVLLSQTKYACCVRPLTAQQKEAWNSMLESVEALRKKAKAKKLQAGEAAAFQQLFLLMGMYLFKAPEESVDLLRDLQNCVEKAQEKKATKKERTVVSSEGGAEEQDQPHWVEVMVEILLSLLSQPSRLIRQVCNSVFGRICPYVTQGALNAILEVLDPNRDDEDGAIVITDEKEKNMPDEDLDKESEGQDSSDKNSEESDKDDDDDDDEDDDDDDDDDDDNDDDDNEEEEPEVDQNFRIELMKVLQGQHALPNEEDESEEEELDDEAMMKLDGNIAALFSEQKKKIQAKKDEKDKLRKEKTLVRDFKIKVLDLVEIFLTKQAESPLVLGIIEPLLNVLENAMSSETSQQEEEFLRKTADTFRNQLCKGKRYCKNISERKDELHAMLERVLSRAQKLSESSLSLYYFSASLYLVKVLRGPPPVAMGLEKEAMPAHEAEAMGSVDVERVTSIYEGALRSFMTHRKSALTGSMFADLFVRFPVLCVRLLDTAVEYIAEGVRYHQQGEACNMVLRGLQTREVQQLLAESRWSEVCERMLDRVVESLRAIKGFQMKAVQEKVQKALELSRFLVRNIQQKKLNVNLEPLKKVLLPMNKFEGFRKTGQLEDTYWSVLKLFGVLKPKVEKKKRKKAEDVEDSSAPEQQSAPKKSKGSLPDSKKRKNRKKPGTQEGKAPEPRTPEVGVPGAGQQGGKKNKKKNKKRKLEVAVASAPSPAKKAKAQPPGAKPEKKRKEKRKQGGDP